MDTDLLRIPDLDLYSMGTVCGGKQRERVFAA